MFTWQFENVRVENGEIMGIQKLDGEVVGDFTYRVVVRDYRYGGKQLSLVDQYGFPEFTATLSSKSLGIDLKPNEVIIKAYSENAGIEDLLEEAGVVHGMREVGRGIYLATISPEFLECAV